MSTNWLCLPVYVYVCDPLLHRHTFARIMNCDETKRRMERELSQRSMSLQLSSLFQLAHVLRTNAYKSLTGHIRRNAIRFDPLEKERQFGMCPLLARRKNMAEIRVTGTVAVVDAIYSSFPMGTATVAVGDTRGLSGQWPCDPITFAPVTPGYSL